MGPKDVITHITFTPAGGAGNAARNLSNALCDQGAHSRLQVRSLSSVTNAPFSKPLVAFLALIDKFIVARKDSSLFSLLRAMLGLKLNNRRGIIHLHWVVGSAGVGTITKQLENAKLFWTLHDFRPITGGCHYPSGCQGFTKTCSNCPQVRQIFTGAVAKAKSDTNKILSSPNLFLIAPSEGIRLAALAAGARNVIKIPNVLDGFWSEKERVNYNPTENFKFVFVSADVTDPIKGLDSVLHWWTSRPKHFESLTLVGANSERISDPVRGLYGKGPLNREELRETLSEADVLVFASSEDNAPGVIAESVALGLPILCLNTEMSTWLAKDGTPLISQTALKSRETFNAFRERKFYPARKIFLDEREPSAVALSHLKLYGLRSV